MLRPVQNHNLASLFSQHYAAARTRIHLDRGGKLPFEPPEPVICPCQVMGTARVIAAHFSEPGFLIMYPPCGHEIRLALNLSPATQVARFEDAAIDFCAMRRRTVAHSYSVVQRLLRLGFTNPPAGYLNPEHMLLEGLYAILAQRQGYTNLTSRLCYLFETMAREDPICLWVDNHVAEAAADSAIPPEPLNETRWYQRRCVFFLPAGTLKGPKGEDCRVLGYTLIEAGLYELLDAPKSLVIYERRIFIWINAPQRHLSFLLDLRLSAWDKPRQMPGDADEAAFYQRALNLILVLNTLGLSPQAVLEEACVQTRGATKKERRKGRHLPRKRLNCPWLRFSRKLQAAGLQQSTGRKMRPHNKPGWFQRYHSQKGTVWHYRPPQRANAHLDAPYATGSR